MKFCNLDESGTGSEPYAVMAGVIVDASRMHITKAGWSGLLSSLSDILGRPIGEIHTRHFYAGNGIWRGLDGKDRARIITLIFNWLGERRHSIVYSAVDKARFRSEFCNEPHAAEVGSLWCFMAFHICLAIQKHFHNTSKNKGNTLMIFDKEENEADNFIKIVRNPPEWTDTYYGRNRKKDRLDQIIDVPYFADSNYVGLIQLADCVSFFLRKRIEMQMGASPGYEDEPAYIENWTNTALELAIPSSMSYPRIGRCSCADLFYRYKPECVRA